MTQSYLEAAWYMAGWASELDDNDRLARTICEIPMLLFRSGADVVAVTDMCSHRFAPLRLGHINDGQVACAYHGLAFDGTGRCVHNPHGGLSSALNIRSFAAREAHRALWIWLGDPATANPELIPDLSFQSTVADTAFSKGYLLGQADYQLYVDNIMDLSHADFLHPNTLGGGSITGARQEVTEGDRTVSVAWRKQGVPASPLQVKLGTFPPEATFDRTTEVRWYAPGAMSLTSTVMPIGEGGNQPSISANSHVMTPGKAGQVHYFFASTRNYRVDDAAFNEEFGRMRDHVFSTEDGPMIQGIFENMNGRDMDEMGPAMLSIDKAAIVVRRKLASLIAGERKQAA